MNNIFSALGKVSVFMLLISLDIAPFYSACQRKLSVKDGGNIEYKLKDNSTNVFVFLDIECPISQQYVRNLEALRVEFSHKNIKFWAVFPSKGVTYQEIVSFQKKFNFHYPFIIDFNKELTIKLDAKITPEVFILNNKSETIYRGAIDDLYYDLGKKRRNASIFYLIDALKNSIEGQPITIKTTQAIGCDIER